MKIGINGYEAVVPRFGQNAQTGLPNRAGSSEYVFWLLQSLYSISTKDKSNEFLVYLPVMPTSDLPRETANWKYVIVPKKSIWTLIDLSWQFLTPKSDLDIFLSPTHYLPLFCPFPSVISVMDLSYLHFPELFKAKDLWQLRLWTKYSIGKAKKVLTISQASKNDIIKEYGVDYNKVAVTYPGTNNPNGKNMNKVLDKYHIKEPYILFVGTIQPRKNITRLIEAFTQLSDKKITLIIVGRPGWMFEDIFATPKKLGIETRVKFLTGVTSEELPQFYKNASCFVLPSLYEGFGLPILEAMQNGCPVITSNVSSMPEAAGDAALYVNPESAEDVSKKISQVLSDDKLRNEMIKKGFEQVKKFSWEKTARETLKVLEEVAKTK